MRKLIVFLTIASLQISAATNFGQPQAVGFLGSNAQGTTTKTCPSAADWFAFSYIPPANVTLQNVNIEISAVTGTLGATDMSVDVYSDAGVAATKPNASLASSTTSSQQTAGFIKFGGGGTGYNFALTANTIYWFVLKNLNGTPASNFPTVRYGTSGTLAPGLNNNPCQMCPWIVSTTTNSGTAWNNLYSNIPFVRLDFTDGSSSGIPLTGFAKDATNTVFAARELGNIFLTQGVQMNIRGILAFVARTSTPTGNVRFGLWNCTGLSTCTNLGYTGGSSGCIGNGQVSTGGVPIACFFSSAITLPPYATIIVSLAEAGNADASSLNYELYNLTVDSAAASLALKQFGGSSMQGAYCTGTCGTYSNWTLNSTSIYGFQLLLDSVGEFTPIPVSAPIAQ